MTTLSPLRSYEPTDVLEVSQDGRALVVRLPTGHRAWYQRREDDCFCAALATLMQVDIEQLPDPRIDERLEAGDDPEVIDREAGQALAVWLTVRGWRLAYHATPPVDRGAWIGVSPGEGPFSDHCLVMCLDRFVHDPASNWSAQVQHIFEVDHGYTIEPL